MTQTQNLSPKALVLGGYGLIGSAIMRALMQAGFNVTGMGRSATSAAYAPQCPWIIADIATTSESDWSRYFNGFDVIVNASGALQDGLNDTLTDLHETAIHRMITALTDANSHFIQISAAGAAPDAQTAFLASKGRGDAALMASGLAYSILRPTMVLGAAAYGGSALLRAAAATPLIGISVLPKAQIQTVALSDVADAVVQCAKGEVSQDLSADLSAEEVYALPQLTAEIRQWLGFPAWRRTLPAPHWALNLSAAIADGLGWLGWRTPIRSTALRVLQSGVRGDPSNWQAAGGKPCLTLHQTLAQIPATPQDRLAARCFLLFPLAVATLSLFWLLSGVIGMIQSDPAIAVLTERDFTPSLAATFVWSGAVADVALGALILWRRWTSWAALGMVALALSYLSAGTLFTPDLWADPLGAFVKVLPSIPLALFVAALARER